MRTEDEHPLKESDIALARKYFELVESTHFHLGTLLAVPLRNTRMFELILGFLYGVDKVLFRLRFFRRQAWFAVLMMQTPPRP